LYYRRSGCFAAIASNWLKTFFADSVELVFADVVGLGGIHSVIARG
jgi:hypothetical protein